jgi:alanine dehydrogenase
METLLLGRKEVASLLQIEECMDAVENAFGMYAMGKALPPKVLALHAASGGFHIKAGILGLERNYFVAKINANFPGNRKKFALPTIQGIIVVCEADDGRLLALMDSIEITIIRTGAATGIATKYLALPNAKTATICGCGNQGRISLQAIMKVRPIEKVYAFDTDKNQIEKFSRIFSGELLIVPVDQRELSPALRQSQIVVTCTTSREPFINTTDILPGTFIAAVGADSEDKQELFPELLASSKIVVDLAEQSAAIGELHHGILKGLVTLKDIHAEIGEIISGKKAGRESEKEIIIFDSTGMALQDVAAAAIVYEKAIAEASGIKMNFADGSTVAFGE